MFIGLVLLAVGVIALLVKTGVLSGSVWSYNWPTILIILGLTFLFGRIFRRRPWRWFGGFPWDDKDIRRKD